MGGGLRHRPTQQLEDYREEVGPREVPERSPLQRCPAAHGWRPLVVLSIKFSSSTVSTPAGTRGCHGHGSQSTAADAMRRHMSMRDKPQESGPTFRGEEKYRIMFEGIACWPYLRATSTGLSRASNMVTTIYADAFRPDYNTFASR